MAMSAAGAGMIGNIFTSALGGLREGLEDEKRYKAQDDASALAQARENRLLETHKGEMEYKRGLIEDQQRRARMPSFTPVGNGMLAVRNPDGTISFRAAPEAPVTPWEAEQRKKLQSAEADFDADPDVPNGLKTAYKLTRDKKIIEDYAKNKWSPKPGAAGITKMGTNPFDVWLTSQGLTREPGQPNTVTPKDADRYRQIKATEDQAKETRWFGHQKAMTESALAKQMTGAQVHGISKAVETNTKALHEMSKLDDYVNQAEKMVKDLAAKRGNLPGVGTKLSALMLNAYGKGEAAKLVRQIDSLKGEFGPLVRTIDQIGSRIPVAEMERASRLIPGSGDTLDQAMTSIQQAREALRRAKAPALAEIEEANRLEKGLRKFGGAPVQGIPTFMNPTPPWSRTPSGVGLIEKEEDE